MTWVQYCVIETDDLFYYLCFVCMCMCAYTISVLREHIVTRVVFGHQRPCWQRLKWWLRTGGLDGKMWINEAQIELIAMTSYSSGAAKWEYVVGPAESQRLYRFQGDGRSKEGKVASLSWLTEVVHPWKNKKNSNTGHSPVSLGAVCSASTGSSMTLAIRNWGCGGWAWSNVDFSLIWRIFC